MPRATARSRPKAALETLAVTIRQMRPTRPPASFVLVTRTRWLEFSRALGERPRVFQLSHQGVVVGWRGAGTHFVDPGAFKAVLGTWPDVYWPDAP
jgi:hypothetical protein